VNNRQLMERFQRGDESALLERCGNNIGLIRSRAKKMAANFHGIRTDDSHRQTDYTSELLSELESEGTLEFIQRIRSGEYDSEKGTLAGYVIPFIDGAMRRYLEKNIGNLSLDRESMALVRRAQELYIRQGKTLGETAEALGISKEVAAKHITYATHFFSVYDLADPEEGGDVFDYLMEDESAGSPERIVCQRIRMEYLRELFDALPKQDKDILGKCYGVFGFRKETLEEIAIYHFMKEDGVEKARNRILKKLREDYPSSMLWWWDEVCKVLWISNC